MAHEACYTTDQTEFYSIENCFELNVMVYRMITLASWLGWMGLMFHFSTRAWSGANTLSLLEIVLASTFPALLKFLSAHQLEVLNLLIRKLAHFTEYAVLTGLGYRAWLIGVQQPQSYAVLLALGCSIMYAIADEIHQSFVPGRTALPTDVLIDITGALAAVWLITRLRTQSVQTR